MKDTHQQQGFTLIETVVAILILSVTIGVLLTLTAGGIFSVRYARNQIAADNLVQETLEFVRNSRDSALQQGIPWDTWLTTLNVNASGVPIVLSEPRGCFHPDRGCIIDPYTTDRKIWEYANGSCSNPSSAPCPNLWFYPDIGFYTYPSRTHVLTSTMTPVRTTYIRRGYAVLDATGSQVTFTVTITWKNGTATKSSTQSMLLTEW